MRDSFFGKSPPYFLLAAVALLLPAGVFAADALSEPPRAVLHLANGGFVSGEIRDSSDPALLRWQAPLFVAPVDFPVSRIDAVYFPAPAKLPKPVGEYCFELAGGDLLFGALLGLDAQEAVLDVRGVGRVHLRRDAIRQFSRWKDGAGIVYRGPNGLDDWTALPSSGAWHNEHGQLTTDQSGASLQGIFALPPRAAIELEISWKDSPDFVLDLGVGKDGASVQAFHIEAWEHDLVILRETPGEAGLAALEKIKPGAGRAHLLVYLDQENGRCLVYSTKGKLLADLKIDGDRRLALPGLRLTNKRGDVCLERLQVAHWTSPPPKGELALGKPRLHLAGGTIQYRELAAYDPVAKTFLLRGAGDAKIPAERIESAFLAQPKEAPPQDLAIACLDSSRVSGSLLKVEKQALVIACPSVREPLRLPLAGLRSVVVNGRDRKPSRLPGSGRGGVLESDDAHLPGHLIDAVRKKDASCLVWQPDESAMASALRPDTNGRIVYREPPAPPRQARQADETQTIMVNVGGRVVQRRIRRSLNVAPQAPAHELTRKALYLVSGDTIPCEVTRIDGNGLSFKSPLSTSTFVPNSKIKAVELTLDGRGPVSLTKSKRERLLTLPRLQKGNPPTHLIRSRDGDYLRGRIVEMDESKLLVEVRLETQEVPRSRISRIIWLHPDELTTEAQASKTTPPAAAPSERVQAMLDDGIRMTFCPERVADSALSGTSDVLGACRVALDSVDQLLLGKAIDEAATRAAYQQWKLQYAIEPKFVQEENNKSAGGGASGTESPLVGKPAPDFELNVLGGDRFHLADHKGKIIVLDFWATWCSHCLQAMPDLVRLHGDSGGRDVEVLAVNLEESPEQISALLERHKWELPVALDKDGAVAAKYGVTAIPQTIIISREGTVVRHYIGEGSHLNQTLSETVRGLMPGAGPQKPAPKAPPKAATGGPLTV